ncbi:hypothetical protein BDZ89DRAFT_1071948 [Hymenopellis radicata]|nr:hypothetical protein BDZ89DRAFT_1071948 [Hymenopellis radicata]
MPNTLQTPQKAKETVQKSCRQRGGEEVTMLQRKNEDLRQQSDTVFGLLGVENPRRDIIWKSVHTG